MSEWSSVIFLRTSLGENGLNIVDHLNNGLRYLDVEYNTFERCSACDQLQSRFVNGEIATVSLLNIFEASHNEWSSDDRFVLNGFCLFYCVMEENKEEFIKSGGTYVILQIKYTFIWLSRKISWRCIPSEELLSIFFTDQFLNVQKNLVSYVSMVYSIILQL